jgi:hypothetical protein
LYTLLRIRCTLSPEYSFIFGFAANSVKGSEYEAEGEAILLPLFLLFPHDGRNSIIENKTTKDFFILFGFLDYAEIEVF